MIDKIVSLFKALNANVNPGEIAHAFSCGILLGFMPKNNLLWYIVFVFIFFIRINKPMYLIMVLIASTFAPVMDNLFDNVGYALLTVPSLADFFGMLLEIPFVAFTKFNNSVVIGSLIVGLILYIPMYALGRVLVFLWRKHIAQAIRHTKLAKTIAKLPLLSKIAGMVGGE
ncbi:TIGR03546 family protein [uncultured Treponema sp.]|uniref:TIGR03546 family protein n=1 Tax=uncultured Treponema sp. TaxID=162155 RepID=UPI0025CC5400|nr:TIGR03546 family protein [uncultured Treponema sp.]